jgi:tetraacyldisaccharide-1-P 4'-kinase
MYWIQKKRSEMDFLTHQMFHPRPLEDASQLEKVNMVTTPEYHVKLQEKVNVRIETVKNLNASLLSWEDDKLDRIYITSSLIRKKICIAS